MSKSLSMALLLSFVAGAGAVWLVDRAAGGRATGPSPTLEPGAIVDQGASSAPSAQPDPTPNAGQAADDRPGARPDRDRRIGNAPAADAARDPASIRQRIENDDPGPDALAALLREWARTAPADFLAALPELVASGVLAVSEAEDTPTGTRSPDRTPYAVALKMAAEFDPRRALTVGEEQSGELGTAIRAAAIETLATVDAQAALEYLAAEEPGAIRDRLLGALATGFARGDLEAAIGWLESLGEADGAGFYPVIATVAEVDLPRALELDEYAISLDYGGIDYGRADWLRPGLEAARQSPASIADQLAAMQSTGFLAETLSWWALDDPYGAIAWIQTRDTISSLVVTRLAATLADKGYGAALDYAVQFAPAVREAWSSAVLRRVIDHDLLAALDLIESYRGQSFHPDLLATALTSVANVLGAPRAAELAGTTPPASAVWQISGIAREYAAIDGLAAAQWAMRMEDPGVRAETVTAAVVRWANFDPAAAQAWVQGIADPTLRENLLARLAPRNCVPAPCVTVQAR